MQLVEDYVQGADTEGNGEINVEDEHEEQQEVDITAKIKTIKKTAGNYRIVDHLDTKTCKFVSEDRGGYKFSCSEAECNKKLIRKGKIICLLL